MWKLDVPWWELIVRGLIVYVFVLVLLRITGKRQVGQLAPFDLVLLLVLSNSVQNAMNGGDNSVLGGVISATTLIALNYAIGYLTWRSKKIEGWVEGKPLILIHNGKLLKDVMVGERITHHELEAALRNAGYTCMEDVQVAVLENNGQITVHGRTKEA